MAYFIPIKAFFSLILSYLRINYVISDKIMCQIGILRKKNDYKINQWIKCFDNEILKLVFSFQELQLIHC